MNKQEKYIEYIVDDLVKNSEIDYETMRLTLPFLSSPTSFPYLFQLLLPHPAFSEYVKERYGVRYGELQIIWDQYKERLKELIDNE